MCKVNQTTSKCRTISCGVPKGSNLGPVLFLLYVNDTPNCLKSTSASMFADDTNLTASGNTITELHNKLNNDLENIHQWLVANKLTFNTSKTEYTMSTKMEFTYKYCCHQSIKRHRNDSTHESFCTSVNPNFCV